MDTSPRRRERSPILHANVTFRDTILLLLEFILCFAVSNSGSRLSNSGWIKKIVNFKRMLEESGRGLWEFARNYRESTCLIRWAAIALSI